MNKPDGKRFSKQYSAYLKSPAWRDVIERYKQAHLFACHCAPDRTGCSGPIELHHLTYERVFNEPLEDLVALCRWHHRQLHRHFDSERQQDPRTSLKDFSTRWVSRMAKQKYGMAWPPQAG